MCIVWGPARTMWAVPAGRADDAQGALHPASLGFPVLTATWALSLLGLFTSPVVPDGQGPSCRRAAFQPWEVEREGEDFWRVDAETQRIFIQEESFVSKTGQVGSAFRELLVQGAGSCFSAELAWAGHGVLHGWATRPVQLASQLCHFQGIFKHFGSHLPLL